MLLSILAFILLLVGCASQRPAPVAVTPEYEKRIALEALPSLRRDSPALKDPELQLRVSNLGMKIVNASGLDGHPYRYSFVVTDSSAVNAFALPAGYVFVTKGMLDRVQNESDLVAVLAHEIAHVEKRHVSRRLENRSREYAVSGAIVGGIAGLGIGSLVCPYDSCVAQLAVTGAGAGVAAGLWAERYQTVAHEAATEDEANAYGAELARRAGYPNASAFYAKLKSEALHGARENSAQPGRVVEGPTVPGDPVGKE